jgi:hypothetical protein
LCKICIFLENPPPSTCFCEQQIEIMASESSKNFFFNFQYFPTTAAGLSSLLLFKGIVSPDKYFIWRP